MVLNHHDAECCPKLAKVKNAVQLPKESAFRSVATWDATAAPGGARLGCCPS